MDREKLENLIKKALDMLYSKDYYLICNHPQSCEEDCHVSERGIVFRFGLYFYQLINESIDGDLQELDLDVEYNRNLQDCKRIPSRKKGAIPDMILHKRGNNDNNFLILEFKTWWNDDVSDDTIKVKDFMISNNGFNYKYGASILIKEKFVEIMWVDYKSDSKLIKYQPKLV